MGTPVSLGGRLEHIPTKKKWPRCAQGQGWDVADLVKERTTRPIVQTMMSQVRQYHSAAARNPGYPG
jgi:hypothetical protein